VTPNRAVATVGRVTAIVAVRVTPPYEALTVALTVPPTARVPMPKVAVVLPAGTVTLAGTVSGSGADNVTRAPAAGAAPVKVTVPFTASPPTTVDALREIDASATALDPPAPTVMVPVCLLVPFSNAVIVAVPAATAVTVKVVDDEAACSETEAGTVNTPVLLLDSVTRRPPFGAAAVRVIVP
jgi:hypothetical protein